MATTKAINFQRTNENLGFVVVHIKSQVVFIYYVFQRYSTKNPDKILWKPKPLQLLDNWTLNDQHLIWGKYLSAIIIYKMKFHNNLILILVFFHFQSSLYRHNSIGL